MTSVQDYKVTCSACPTQIEGLLADGRFFYFRARHGTWTLELGDTQEDAVSGDLLASGEDRTYGFMDPDDAMNLVHAALRDLL